MFNDQCNCTDTQHMQAGRPKQCIILRSSSRAGKMATVFTPGSKTLSRLRWCNAHDVLVSQTDRLRLRRVVPVGVAAPPCAG